MTKCQDQTAIIHDHFAQLVQKFPRLELSEDQPGLWVIRGDVHFFGRFDGTTLEDSFNVLLKLPDNYPDSAPTVQETGGRIPRTFHTFPDGCLCLGAPVDVQLKFMENPNLLNFTEEQVIPYLYAFSYWSDNGEMPFGELPHGGKGLLEYYNNLFHIAGHIPTLSLLRILVEKSYRGHNPCPCGSGEKLRKCHGLQLKELTSHRTSEGFFYDMSSIFASLPTDDQEHLPTDVIPMFYIRRIQNKSLRPEEKRP